MPVIQLKADLSFDQLANAVGQLSNSELERLFAQVACVRPLYEEHRLSDTESELLMKINEGVSDTVQSRYNKLIGKRDERTLTDEEYSELLRLTDQVELLDVNRLEYLTELARIRNKPLTLLMDELGITPPEYA
ncbi:MAG: STAS/SEC14 domain-containing protein [Desulfobacteraceae bacterium]|nr:STAS/SEC14 domain-containing protein [Desulfobacteraceae bacterium]